MTKVVVLDNYDSFTFNLVQLIGEVGGIDAEVHRSDRITLAELAARAPTHLVISPGPGRGDDPKRLGVGLEAIERLDVSILGVCLGHQAIGHVFGAKITGAPRPLHGKTSRVTHDGTGIFADLPAVIEAMRYHSLIVDPATLPRSLRATAWTLDGVLMGLRHVSRPVFGVQFHPESIGTPDGHAIIRRFLEPKGSALRQPMDG
ncbi:MAG: aminodeoxychorismate/anthranilate synthase component II [Deltaproteobacteria bacterium]|nr:aminodeoxychorismate/anthranilate synthase component II [Deltaproteobacteria bacterium]